MLSNEPSLHGSHECDIKVFPDSQENDGGHWYFSQKEIEENSRQDGIDLKKETYMRKSYCTHLPWGCGYKCEVSFLDASGDYCDNNNILSPFLHLSAPCQE
ncbi:hypothetical protein ABFX02_04G226400 [Erythranthe guttata]